MSDAVDRTVEVLGDALGSSYSHAVRRLLVRRLDAAGLLATTEHDRQVAASALREAADEIDNPSATPEVESAADAASHLRDRADQIERGEQP